jgi:probable F420-dependent oxidoreductase
LVPEFCRVAERAGFGSLWVAEHVAVPLHFDSAYTLGRSAQSVVEPDALHQTMGLNLEMIVTLATAAAHTNDVILGTGVAVPPLRNPVVNARQLASVDLYSAGRLLYGVGVGWLAEEAGAIGMPWDRRGARTDEHIALLRSIWTSHEPFEFHGEFYDVPPIQPEPRPAQQPIPILIGGHSDTALRRVARLGDGWLASGMSVPRLRERLSQLAELCEAHGRALSELTLVGTASFGSTRLDKRADAAAIGELLDDYAALGLDHLVVSVDGHSPDELLANLAWWNETGLTSRCS